MNHNLKLDKTLLASTKSEAVSLLKQAHSSMKALTVDCTEVGTTNGDVYTRFLGSNHPSNSFVRGMSQEDDKRTADINAIAAEKVLKAAQAGVIEKTAAEKVRMHGVATL